VGALTGHGWGRRQVHGVVGTATKPERSRMGREYDVESLRRNVAPIRSADRARAAVNAR
jgi:hypothetical protein